MGKPIKVVNESDWYCVYMPRIKKGVLALWRTANCTYVPVEVISGQSDLQVKDASNGLERGKEYGIYIENIVELEFPDEIIRVDRPLTSFKAY
jgi:hypothetical protein